VAVHWPNSASSRVREAELGGCAGQAGVLAAVRPVAGAPACVRQREDDDLVADDLIRQREQEPIDRK